MRRLALVAMGVCLAGSTSLAQDPVKANPKIYHVLVDNARVRVLHVIAGPGEKTTLHDHPDNITVLLTDGKITFTGADGKSETMDTKAGTALWSGPQKHAGANPGSAPLEAVVIELKGSAAPTAKLPSLASQHDADRARRESTRRRHPCDRRCLVYGRAQHEARLRPDLSSHPGRPRSRSRSAARRRPPGSGATRCSSAAAKRIRRRTPAASRWT